MGDLSKNLDSSEVACKCGCGLNKISPMLIGRFQTMRDNYGKTLIINSGVRCESHNAKVGGSVNSEHIPNRVTGEGNALDIKMIGGRERHYLIYWAQESFDRVGIAQTFIHVGTGPTHEQDVTWLYPVK